MDNKTFDTISDIIQTVPINLEQARRKLERNSTIVYPQYIPKLMFLCLDKTNKNNYIDFYLFLNKEYPFEKKMFYQDLDLQEQREVIKKFLNENNIEAFSKINPTLQWSSYCLDREIVSELALEKYNPYINDILEKIKISKNDYARFIMKYLSASKEKLNIQGFIEQFESLSRNKQCLFSEKYKSPENETIFYFCPSDLGINQQAIEYYLMTKNYDRPVGDFHLLRSLLSKEVNPGVTATFTKYCNLINPVDEFFWNTLCRELKTKERNPNIYAMIQKQLSTPVKQTEIKKVEEVKKKKILL